MIISPFKLFGRKYLFVFGSSELSLFSCGFDIFDIYDIHTYLKANYLQICRYLQLIILAVCEYMCLICKYETIYQNIQR